MSKRKICSGRAILFLLCDLFLPERCRSDLRMQYTRDGALKPRQRQRHARPAYLICSQDKNSGCSGLDGAQGSHISVTRIRSLFQQVTRGDKTYSIWRTTQLSALSDSGPNKLRNNRALRDGGLTAVLPRRLPKTEIWASPECKTFRSRPPMSLFLGDMQ